MIEVDHAPNWSSNSTNTLQICIFILIVQLSAWSIVAEKKLGQKSRQIRPSQTAGPLHSRDGRPSSTSTSQQQLITQADYPGRNVPSHDGAGARPHTSHRVDSGGSDSGEKRSHRSLVSRFLTSKARAITEEPKKSNEDNRYSFHSNHRQVNGEGRISIENDLPQQYDMEVLRTVCPYPRIRE